MKFTKSETKSVAAAAGPGITGAAAWAGYLCSKVPIGAGVAACSVVVAVVAYLLARSFDSAAADGKCIELHFPGIAGPFWWKTEGC